MEVIICKKYICNTDMVRKFPLQITGIEIPGR